MLNSFPLNSGICDATNLKSIKEGTPPPEPREEATVDKHKIFPNKIYIFLSTKVSPDIL